MCGIAGWFGGRGLASGELEAMGRSLSHRGPDDAGCWEDYSAGIGFGHRRLSIIDLSAAGHQPITNEDGSVVLTFNGEIYNFKPLRAELEARGHRFRFSTDSEVLVHGWEEWGEGLLGRIRGMYAFGIWDRRTQRLVLARDPMGIKPLFYWWHPDGALVFASEMKAFLAIRAFERRPDRRALAQFLEFGFVPEEERATLEGVRRLPAGHALSLERSDVGEGTRPPSRRFYVPPTTEPSDGRAQELAERADRLHRVLSGVVEEHLVADVPVGLLLSGGLDSGVVAALARKKGRLRTISMGFADSAVDERAFARRVADFLGTDHQEVLIRPEEVFEGLEDSSYYVDDLFGDWGVISTMVLYRKCREAGVKVVLVGEGSDELFGGYPDFDSAGGVEAEALGPRIRALRLYRWFSGRRWGWELAKLYGGLRSIDAETGGDYFSTVRLFETRHQLPGNFNMKVDRASMAASVEARVPFLDQRVAEEGFRTPRELLLRDGTNKFLLRFMAQRHGLLPPEIAWRPKFGGSIASTWMERSESFRSFAQSVILDRSGWTEELGLRKPMEDYFFCGRKGYPFPWALSILSIVAWRLLMLNLWARHYLTRK